jgi:site-specific DNA recombinase
MKRKLETTGNGHKSALVYCRVSTKNQEDGTSLETQAKACIKHAESLGYSIGRVTKEVYSGADLFDRPLLARDRADLRAGQFQAVICYAIDRLSRDIAHLAIIADECERAGAELIFVTESLDQSPEGKLLQSVRGYVAEVERQKIKERTMRGKLARIQAGKVYNFGDDMYGYTRDREQGIRIIKDEEGEIVRRIFKLYVVDGMGIERIARRLNEEGVPSPKAGKRKYSGGRIPLWHGHAIHNILTRTEYKGEAMAWKYSRPRVAGKLKRIRRDISEQVRLPASTTPAIVSNDIWQQAQERLKTNAGHAFRNEHTPCLLRGLIFCGKCKRPMFVGSGSARPSTKRYRCFTTSRSVTGEKCNGGSTRVSQADATVWELIVYIVQRPEIIIQALREQSEQEPDARLSADREAVERQIKKLQAGMATLVHQLSISHEATVLSLIQQKLAEAE